MGIHLVPIIEGKALNPSILQRALLVRTQQAGHKTLNKNAFASDVNETGQGRVEAGDGLHVTAESVAFRRERRRNTLGGCGRTQENPTRRAIRK